LNTWQILVVGTLGITGINHSAVVPAAAAEIDAAVGVDLVAQAGPPQEVQRFWNRELWGRVHDLESDASSDRSKVNQLMQVLEASETRAASVEQKYQMLLKDHLQALSTMRRERDTLVDARLKSVEEEQRTSASKRSEHQDAYESLSSDYDSLSSDYDSLSSDYDSLSSDYDSLSSDYDSLTRGITKVQEQVSASDRAHGESEELIERNRADLRGLEKKVDSSKGDILDTATDLDGSVRYNGLRTAVGGVAVVLLGLTLVLAMRKMASSRRELEERLTEDRESARKDYLALDLTLTGLLEQQLQPSPASGVDTVGGVEPDHELPLAVLAEVHRMKKRLTIMPESTKGIKPLSKALERLEGNLETRGYGMGELLGSKYVEGMTMHTTFAVDSSLAPGEQIISKVVKPQITYHDAVIQVADVEVSRGD
jgi:hypothetical protein